MERCESQDETVFELGSFEGTGKGPSVQLPADHDRCEVLASPDADLTNFTAKLVVEQPLAANGAAYRGGVRSTLLFDALGAGDLLELALGRKRVFLQVTAFTRTAAGSLHCQVRSWRSRS